MPLEIFVHYIHSTQTPRPQPLSPQKRFFFRIEFFFNLEKKTTLKLNEVGKESKSEKNWARGWGGVKW